MVYYFTAKPMSDDDFTISTPSTIYMGKDKIENDPLIKHSHPKNIWFHVDNHSSAHLYLQLTKEQLVSFKSFDKFTIDSDILSQIAQLTKANSIKGNKLNNITVIYTPVENLHTDGSMDIGTVTFKNPKQVKRINVTKKENAIINKLNKTKTEITTEKFIENQEMLMRDILKERKQYERDMEEQRKQYEAQKEKNSDPYADLYNENILQTNEFRNENWVEDDFM